MKQKEEFKFSYVTGCVLFMIVNGLNPHHYIIPEPKATILARLIFLGM